MPYLYGTQQLDDERTIISNISAQNQKLSEPTDLEYPNQLGMSTHTAYVHQEIHQKSIHALIIVKIWHVNVDNHNNNAGHHKKTPSVA